MLSSSGALKKRVLVSNFTEEKFLSFKFFLISGV